MVLKSGGRTSLTNLLFCQWWYWYAESVTDLLCQHQLLSGRCCKEEKKQLKIRKVSGLRAHGRTLSRLFSLVCSAAAPTLDLLAPQHSSQITVKGSPCRTQATVSTASSLVKALTVFVLNPSISRKPRRRVTK